jgi:transcriptional regulator with XRE-family HTH domain
MNSDAILIIKKYLDESHLSMRHFGKELGVSHAAVSYWISGKMEPSTDYLIGLLDDYSDWRRGFATDLLQLHFPDFMHANNNGHNPDPCEEKSNDK